ncbi:polymer-forming cytoskeletal [Lucifera butyrica]|uniref:Polymer-forming cytoskeletal n=1 Tax=Lucifera butyrica TaxID=1351585 RepID=A0A498R4X4_9FIRM|nr:polymer-forming cytoskeletal protein [Lucifera butyrica]VBB05312.1 polymer-forming cytoskeletal [Lucifera butyrica]
MDNPIRYELKIAGQGTAAGGIYNNVTINGYGNIQGNLDCIHCKVNGVSQMAGCLKTETLKVNGEGTIKENLSAAEIKVNGSLTVQGHVAASQMHIHGSITAQAAVAAETMVLEGLLRVSGDCTAGTLELKGAFTIDGLLNAGTLEVSLYGSCQAREIGGESITIKKGASFKILQLIQSIFLPAGFGEGKLMAETVEGNDIYLEQTEANVVRGNNVHIGPGCKIRQVEYKNHFYQTDDASVVSVRQI